MVVCLGFGGLVCAVVLVWLMVSSGLAGFVALGCCRDIACYSGDCCVSGLGWSD